MKNFNEEHIIYALENAIIWNDIGIVMNCLEHDFDINKKITRDGYTALELAIKHKRFATASLLINAGADIEHRDKFNNTLLITAAINNDHETVNYLLSAGADVTAKKLNHDRDATDIDYNTGINFTDDYSKTPTLYKTAKQFISLMK